MSSHMHRSFTSIFKLVQAASTRDVAEVPLGLESNDIIRLEAILSDTLVRTKRKPEAAASILRIIVVSGSEAELTIIREPDATPGLGGTWLASVP